MTIGRRLTLSFVLLAAVTALSGHLMYRSVARLPPELARVVDNNLPEIEALYQVSDSLHRLLGATRAYLLMRTESERTTGREAVARLDAAVRRFADVHGDAEHSATEHNLRRMAENAREIATDVLDVPSDRLTKSHALMFSTRVAQVLLQSNEIVSGGVGREGGELRGVAVELGKDIEHLSDMARGTTIVTLALALALAGWLMQRITRPTRHLTQVAQAIADGDLQRRAVLVSRDEIGTLAATFNTMADALVRQQEDLRSAEAEARRLAAEQGQMAELKNRFVTMASHEFRTPLAVISAASDAMLRYADRMSPAQQVERLQKIQREVRHMAGLLEEVLTIGRSDADKLECQLEAVDVWALCAEVLDEVRSNAAVTHRLLLDAHSRVTTISVDPRLLRQVLSNLVGNAVKYSPRGGDVRCSIESVADAVVIVIADQGIGIPAADQMQMFEPVHRGTNVGSIQGTGLGMAIIKRVVDAHGGAIVVESSEGQGTTVRVRLPLAPPA